MIANERLDRNPLFAVAYNYGSNIQTPYKPGRMIDTLRLFIDLVDVSHLKDDLWTSSSKILTSIREYHKPNTEEGITEDIFLWTLEILGPDFWESIDEEALYTSMFWCLEYGQEERIQRLLKLCNNVVNARDSVNEYNLLHTKVVDRT